MKIPHLLLDNPYQSLGMILSGCTTSTCPDLRVGQKQREGKTSETCDVWEAKYAIFLASTKVYPLILVGYLPWRMVMQEG